ncbi:TspO/MBR family protein [Aphelenchoides avenae]|nr:TspO/MBR family protein [Aphelenchus avenae]
MPYLWTSEDTRKALLSTLIPATAGGLATYAFIRDPDHISFLKSARTPTWLPRNRLLYAALDVGTVAPLGYASYLVYRNGGGFEYVDTSIALALYGATLGLGVGTVGILKKQNFKLLFGHTVLLHAMAAATAYAFYIIDKQAAYWIAPFSIWTGIYAFITYHLYKLNGQTNGALKQ